MEGAAIREEGRPEAVAWATSPPPFFLIFLQPLSLPRRLLPPLWSPLRRFSPWPEPRIPSRRRNPDPNPHIYSPLVPGLGRFKMDNRSIRLGGLGQLFPEFLSEPRIPTVDVICPQPRRAAKVSCLFDYVGSLSAKANCILATCHEDTNLNLLNLLLDKGETDDELDKGNQCGFFCGSPPVRTNNPVVWDALFTNEDRSFASVTTIHETTPWARVERISLSCGSSFETKPEMRTEDFITHANPAPGLMVSGLS